MNKLYTIEVALKVVAGFIDYDNLDYNQQRALGFDMSPYPTHEELKDRAIEILAECLYYGNGKEDDH